MRKLLIGAGVLIAVGVYWAKDSRLRRAFLHHQQQESGAIKAYYPLAGGESFVLSERWKNYQKYAKQCPAIPEVVSVLVSKTREGNYVITMRGPDGGKYGSDGFELDTCSLWLNGDQVSDFTSY